MGRRVAIAAPEGREAGGRADLRALRHFADRDPDPLVVERGPARDAMERGNHFCGRKSQELVVREADRLVDRAVHAEVPLLRVEPGDDAQVEPRPFPNLPLPGRETSLRRHPTETIEIPRYKSLCLTFEGRGCGRRGPDPVSLPILHVRPHLRHLRRRRDLPPPLGLRVGRPAEFGVARGQVLDLPVPRDHVRRHAIRAQKGGGHPDMSAVVTGSPSITGRSVPGAEKEVLAQLQVAFGSKLKDAKIVRERLVELVIDRADLVPLCSYLKDTLGFEHLSCVTAVDWKDHFESIYHIENYYNGCMVQVNAQIPYDDPKIATLTGLWHAADFLEREMWDLMGVEYTGHPNLTRILLPEDFKFHPLRKEFAQEVDRQYITRRKLRGGK